MKEELPADVQDEAPLLAQQRRSLDAMSAQLTHNLNLMIAEQEARAHAFAARLPEAPQQMPVPQPAATPQPQRRKAQAVPPPPVKSAPTHAAGGRYAAPAQQPVARRGAEASAPPLPPLPQRRKTADKKKSEGFGTVPTLVTVAVIVLLLRACS